MLWFVSLVLVFVGCAVIARWIVWALEDLTSRLDE